MSVSALAPSPRTDLTHLEGRLRHPLDAEEQSGLWQGMEGARFPRLALLV